MDIRCVICGELWDAWGIRHGDMLPWEAELFRAGAGCPGCEGVSNGWEMSSMEDCENGDEDPMIRINQYERALDGKAPEWKRPDPKILWTCSGCGVQAVINPDDNEKEYNIPPEAKCKRWYHSHPFQRNSPDDEPAATIDDLTMCEFCTTICNECGEVDLALNVNFSDCYDRGYPFYPKGCYATTSAVCLECYQNIEDDENLEDDEEYYTVDLDDMALYKEASEEDDEEY